MSVSRGEILFFSEEIKFSLRDRMAKRKWLFALAALHRRKIASLNYIFTSDKFLLAMNKKFLRHNTLTDIITFDFSVPSKKLITGEIYVSIPRIKENAKKFEVPFSQELDRVMAHGLLHLCGFSDKKTSEQKRMRTEEEKALDLRH